MSFSSRIGSQLGELLGNEVGGYMKRKQNIESHRQLAKQVGIPEEDVEEFVNHGADLTTDEYIQQLQQVAKYQEMQKNLVPKTQSQGESPFVKAYKGKIPENRVDVFSEAVSQGKDAKEQLAIAKQLGDEYGKEKEYQDEISRLDKITNRMLDLHSQGTWARLPGTKTAGRAAEIDGLARKLEDRLTKMVGKGALSEARFNYATEILPSPWDTEEVFKGKIRAIREILELPEDQLDSVGHDIVNSIGKEQLAQEEGKEQGRI